MPRQSFEKEYDIELLHFRPSIYYPKTMVEKFGGRKAMAALLDNIISRYAVPEYFDLSILEN